MGDKHSAAFEVIRVGNIDLTGADVYVNIPPSRFAVVEAGVEDINIPDFMQIAVDCAAAIDEGAAGDKAGHGLEGNVVVEICRRRGCFLRRVADSLQLRQGFAEN